MSHRVTFVAFASHRFILVEFSFFNRDFVLFGLQACQIKMWSLVRHTAGLLKKRVEDLAEVSLYCCLYFLCILGGKTTTNTSENPEQLE